MVQNIKTLLSFVMAVFPALFFSQEIKQMTANEVAELALQNHQQLKVSAQNIDIAKQNTNVVKLQKLPNITASTSQFYLGDAIAKYYRFNKSVLFG